MKVLADRAGLCKMRRCLKLPRCSGDAVRQAGVTTPRCLLLVSAAPGFDGWEYLSQVPDGFGRRGNSGCTRLSALLMKLFWNASLALLGRLLQDTRRRMLLGKSPQRQEVRLPEDICPDAGA